MSISWIGLNSSIQNIVKILKTPNNFLINYCIFLRCDVMSDWNLLQVSMNVLIMTQLKEEIHNRFNLISEERVKFFKHNSENLMKIGWKIRKLWHFEVSQIFKKHFLTSQYEYANEWGDDVIASQFSIHFVHRNDKKINISAMKMLDLP